jgi:hypothetical protein
LAEPGQITSDYKKQKSSPKLKNILLFRSCKSVACSAVSRPHEGRFAVVTKRWAGDAMDALGVRRNFAPDEIAGAYGQVVWS